MSQYRESIEAIGLRKAGPHNVLDTVRDGPPPSSVHRESWPEHVVVVCQDCEAEWFECGLYPAKCPAGNEDRSMEDMVPDEDVPNRYLSGTLVGMNRK